MPELDKNVHSKLVFHHFIAGLPTHISTQLRATGDTKKLDDTMQQARLLMSINPQAPVAAVELDLSEVQQLKDQITELTEQVAALTMQHLASQRKNVSTMMASDTFNVTAPAHKDVNRTSDQVIIVANLDTLPEVAASVRETVVGRL